MHWVAARLDGCIKEQLSMYEVTSECECTYKSFWVCSHLSAKNLNSYEWQLLLVQYFICSSSSDPWKILMCLKCQNHSSSLLLFKQLFDINLNINMLCATCGFTNHNYLFLSLQPYSCCHIFPRNYFHYFSFLNARSVFFSNIRRHQVFQLLAVQAITQREANRNLSLLVFWSAG